MTTSQPTTDQRFPIAVAGATGLVGEALLEALAERGFPVDKLYALGRGDDDEASVLFAERPVRLTALADFDFSRCRLAFFCVPAEVAKQHVPRALAAGCHVVDASAQFRLRADVPLVAADLGGATVSGAGPHLVASPGAPALQVATLLQPLNAAAGLAAVDVTVMASVSKLGRAGVDELAGQTARLLNAQSAKPKVFPTQIAFNTVPAFDAADASGFTGEELQTVAEIRKLLGNEGLAVNVSEVFLPVFYGHSLVIRVETRSPLTAAAAQRLLGAAPGVAVSKGKKPFGPVDLGGTEPAIRIGRIRQAPDSDRVLTLWSVADNVRKGAAVNSVQIAETLLKPYL
jgi:aspartate-semialdehyde dehydrogenase